MKGSARVAFGSLAGAGLAALAALMVRPLFSPPTVGVGFVTVHGYPKSWDYAVVALLVAGAFAGGAAVVSLLRESEAPALNSRLSSSKWVMATSAFVFALMLFVHDHPYAHMDNFHEGEHLTAGWLMKSGERPYADFFVFHGLAVDAGLDALVLGDPPSPFRPRRLQTVLDAATLALLVPIAAEVTVTVGGMLIGVLVSLCAVAALWLPVFPYFRMAPLLVAVLALLRYVRNGSTKAFAAAAVSATLGVVWSLDTGTYAVAGFIGVVALVRLLGLEEKPLPLPRLLLIVFGAFLLPLIVLIAVGADIKQFLVDSFVLLPRAIDATWALPAPSKWSAEALRYYVPPAFYGFLAALVLLCWRRGDRRRAAEIAILAVFSLLLFRTAAGRVGWSHTRFALPLFGIAAVAFVLEPLVIRRRWVVTAVLAIALLVHVELVPNLTAGTKLLASWPARQRHEGLVRYPFPTGRGIYTTSQNALDLGSLGVFIDSLGPRDAPILDFSNERALYYLLQRKPSMRCMEISMLSVPELLAEATAQLEANPPLCVIVAGAPEIAAFDGVPNRDRVPQLAAWIDRNYPRRTEIGRFVIAHK